MKEAAYLYNVQLPARMHPGQKYPVLFTLHGKGSNESNMYGLVEELQEHFIIIGIRGNLVLGNGYQYYDLKSLGNPIREQFDQAMTKLEQFMEQITQEYPIDEGRRYVLGFSQGAILAMSLALVMGDRLKGIVALNGYVPEFVKTEYSLRSTEEVSVFISHGQFDPIFPVEIGHQNADYFNSRTSRVTFHLYPSEHTVSSDNQRDVIQWLSADAGLQQQI
ncbi:alpha/beta hydrolase [Paenibacillus sp. SYP-B4298]|uniref:alpha/beta hydrolase n=1 Tax=Paenibacillus sp. SYP-B4298 TaxID=2996034 RepID=UPI0022DE8578|nr:alpha/beta hydrolase-fold protein [Paenibacillus sp. SYP-B4298]